MFDQGLLSGSRSADFPAALSQIPQLWEPDLPLYSNLANVSALLKACLHRTNWLGFYLWDERRACLVLGPFQGLPACTRIAAGRGVCGTALAARKTMRVADVRLRPGHIACDAASRSEIVVPVFRGAEALGVLDVDSPEVARFDAIDQDFLEKAAATLVPLWSGGSAPG